MAKGHAGNPGTFGNDPCVPLREQSQDWKDWKTGPMSVAILVQGLLPPGFVLGCAGCFGCLPSTVVVGWWPRATRLVQTVSVLNTYSPIFMFSAEIMALPGGMFGKGGYDVQFPQSSGHHGGCANTGGNGGCAHNAGNGGNYNGGNSGIPYNVGSGGNGGYANNGGNGCVPPQAFVHSSGKGDSCASWGLGGKAGNANNGGNYYAGNANNGGSNNVGNVKGFPPQQPNVHEYGKGGCANNGGSSINGGNANNGGNYYGGHVSNGGNGSPNNGGYVDGSPPQQPNMHDSGKGSSNVPRQQPTAPGCAKGYPNIVYYP